MKRIKLCLVGLNFGTWMIEQELKMGRHELIELTAVCDMNRPKAELWAEKLNCKAYDSIDEMLKDPEIEAVGLFTGPVGRAELIDKIISSGRDVMTTKPFELSSEKAMAVLQKAERLGRVVHLNSPSTLPMPDMQKIRDWIETYHLGRPVSFRASAWCSYREKADGSWYDDEYLCPVAPVFRLGIYLINDLIPLFGRVEELHSQQSRLFTQRPTPDNAQLSMRFENGALGTIYASFCVNDGQCYRNSLELNFENGTIYRNAGPYIRREGEKCHLALSAMTEEGQKVLETEIDECGSGYQWENFYRAVHGEKLVNAVTPEEIVNGIRVIEAMREQAAKGRGDGKCSH